MGRNKRTGDRSYCEKVVKLLEETDTHMVVKIVYGNYDSSIGETRLLMKDEYDIMPAGKIGKLLHKLGKITNCSCCE
jgi:hypothetical protein